METAKGRVLPERIPYAPNATVAWLPDSSGFYCNARRAPETRDVSVLIYFHRPGEAPPTEPEPVDLAGLAAAPQVSRDGRYACVLVGQPGGR